MSRAMMFLSCMGVLVIAVGLSGCGGEGEGDSVPAADPPEATGGDEHAGHDHAEGDHADHMPATKVDEALAELSPADRAAAEKQRICPVTGELLGAMGKPIKITHEGTDVFLCCEMCKDSFADDPGKYMAKLNK